MRADTLAGDGARRAVAVASACLVIACVAPPPSPGTPPPPRGGAPSTSSAAARPPATPSAPDAPSVAPGGAAAPSSVVLVARHAPLDGCDASSLATLLGRHCKRVAPLVVRGPAKAAAAAASDADACTMFHSGSFPPVEVWLELPQGSRVDALVWIAEQTPPHALVEHAITLVPPDAPPITLRARAVTSTSIPYAYVLPGRTSVAAIEVRTLASPSHVAWRELVAVDCGGAPRLPDRGEPALTALPKPPPPPPERRERARGRGWCKTDADCVPEGCCRSGATCVATFAAPRCDGGCPASVGPYDTGASRCLCDAGTCAAEHVR